MDQSIHRHMFPQQPGAQLGNVAGLQRHQYYGGETNLRCTAWVCVVGSNGVCLIIAWNLRKDSRGYLDRLELVFSRSPLPPLPLPRSSFG